MAESFFFLRDTAATEIYTLSLHDALPIYRAGDGRGGGRPAHGPPRPRQGRLRPPARPDRKSTRLNSSHSQTSYAVFCLKKKNDVVTYNLQHHLLRHDVVHPLKDQAPKITS